MLGLPFYEIRAAWVDAEGRGGECSLVAFAIRAGWFFPLLPNHPFAVFSSGPPLKIFWGARRLIRVARGLESCYSARSALRGSTLFRLSCWVAYLRALRSAGGSAGGLVMYLFFGGGYVGAGGASSLLPLFGGGARNSFPVGRSVAS